MFKPDSTYKKLANKGGFMRNCAYVYPDGVMLWEKRTLKSGQYTSQIDVHHVWFCEIPIKSSDYSKDWGRGAMQCKRLVVRDPRALLDGIQSIEVIYGDASDNSKEKGVKATIIRLTTSSGAVHETMVINCLSSDITAQPDYFGFHGSADIPTLAHAVEQMRKDYENVEIHSAQPVQAQAIELAMSV